MVQRQRKPGISPEDWEGLRTLGIGVGGIGIGLALFAIISLHFHWFGW